MIQLKPLLLAETDRLTALRAGTNHIQQWKDYWFKIRQELRQAVFSWKQDGIVSDSDYSSATRHLDELGEFFKNVSRQSNKLMGGGLGPKDYETAHKLRTGIPRTHTN